MLPDDQSRAGFFVIPFGIDGESLGIGFWEITKLSPRWLDFCSSYLKTDRSGFDMALPDRLSHLRVKWSSATGSALLTIFADGKLVSSAVILSGHFPASDSETVVMFVSSLRKAIPEKLADRAEEPFAELLTATDRPVMGVVHFSYDDIDGATNEVVRELGLHFAGAFLANADSSESLDSRCGDFL